MNKVLILLSWKPTHTHKIYILISIKDLVSHKKCLLSCLKFEIKSNLNKHLKSSNEMCVIYFYNFLNNPFNLTMDMKLIIFDFSFIVR